MIDKVYTAANVPWSMFDEWWLEHGQYLDPDTSDVPWFDKRRGLAEMAYNAALARSGNYTCDTEVYPSHAYFENGRVVKIVAEAGRHYLDISRKPYPPQNINRSTEDEN